MKQAFDLFDKNHDGRISSDELGRVLRTLGHDHSQEEVEDMIKTADTNGESKPLMGSIKYITLVLMSRDRFWFCCRTVTLPDFHAVKPKSL